VPIAVDQAETERRCEELVAKVEADEEIVIFREGEPVAKLVARDGDRRRAAIEKTIEDVSAFRAHAQPVTAEELIAWKNEGRRY
jgi:antitoxin (DNA-binding transcriptional repressor) of toxin-antitoxin stability system